MACITIQKVQTHTYFFHRPKKQMPDYQVLCARKLSYQFQFIVDKTIFIETVHKFKFIYTKEKDIAAMDQRVFS